VRMTECERALAPQPWDRKIGVMTELQFADEVLGRLRAKHPRFHGKAYLFLLSALHRVIEELEEPRHISGQELAAGVRGLALDRYGPMARTVLEHWGIHTTEDIGDIVFAMVEFGLLTKQDEDRREDFRDVFDFAEAFEQDYPWAAGI
jgi:uncharacterized repeat protein (TIGR04138 family)